MACQMTVNRNKDGKKMNCFFEFDKCVQWMTCNFFTYFFLFVLSLGRTGSKENTLNTTKHTLITRPETHNVRFFIAAVVSPELLAHANKTRNKENKSI